MNNVLKAANKAAWESLGTLRNAAAKDKVMKSTIKLTIETVTNNPAKELKDVVEIVQNCMLKYNAKVDIVEQKILELPKKQT